MRQRIGHVLGTVWAAIKSPVGLVIVGGVAGSITTDVLGNTHREHELRKAKDSLEHERERNRALYEKAAETKDREQVLLFALREADKYGNRARADLETCKRQKRFIRYAFDNSFCFYRQKLTSNASKGTQTANEPSSSTQNR